MCFAAKLILTTLFAVTVSQVSIRTDKHNVKDDERVVLTCTVPNFDESVFVIQNITSTIYNRAVCVANTACVSTNISGYSVAKSGTDVIFTILSFSKASDVGLWFVRYGSLNTSTPVTLSAYTESQETSTNFKSSSIIESTSTSFFVESNAGVSPTDASQLNTLNTFSVSSDAEIFLSSIATSDRKHTSASFKTENFETIHATNASFFMHSTSSEPNSLLTSMSLIPNLDSYQTNIQSSMIKTKTVSSLTVTIESDYQSTFDSSFTEFANSFLTSGLYITTSEIFSGLIYSALKSSFSVTTEVYPMSTYTDTVSTGTITSDQMFEMKETTAITPITAANVFSRNSLSDDIPVLQTTFDSITSSGSTIHQFMASLLTSTAIYSITSISEEAGFNSSFTLEATRFTNSVLTADEYESMMTSNLDHHNTSVFELASGIIPTNSQSFSEISLDSYYSVSTFISFLTTHEGILISTNDPNTENDMGLFNSSVVNPNFLLSLNATSNNIKEASDSQFNLINSELSGTSSMIIFEKEDFSTTPLSYSSVIDTVKHTSDFVMTSPFNERFIQTSSVRNNEAESAYTERYSSLPTKLFTSMPDKITETVSSAYDDKFILLTSTEHILQVTSSLNTLGSFTSGMDDSERITESFVKTISRSSNELAISSSSLDKFSPKYVKTTSTIQHGLSESSKDDIFISALSGTIGAFILLIFIAMVISRYLMKRNKSKDEKDDEISNQLGWSDDGGINSYNKNYTSREFPFNSSIHLPLNSYNESPYLSYANYYKKNWDDNT